MTGNIFWRSGMLRHRINANNTNIVRWDNVQLIPHRWINSRLVKPYKREKLVEGPCSRLGTLPLFSFPCLKKTSLQSAQTAQKIAFCNACERTPLDHGLAAASHNLSDGRLSIRRSRPLREDMSSLVRATAAVDVYERHRAHGLQTCRCSPACVL